MKRFPVLALSALIVIWACAVPGLGPAATATPVPTNTAAPTSTATATPTPEPTATPDAAATSAAQSTETAASVVVELDRYLKNSDIPYQDGHLIWQQTNSFSINLSGPGFEIQGIDDAPSAGNFIFKSDVTWEATGLLICGAVFRSEPDVQRGEQYTFSYLRLSGLPAWSIDVLEDGAFKNSPTDVRFSGALDLKNGASNTFLIAVQDDNFTVYINRTREGKYFDYSKQRTEGGFGFLASQDSGNGTCEYENSWVWSLD
jgi:hypothetical protein